MSYICHHGILGMKWGIRRYQNEDGTLTEAGKKRYYSGKEQKRFAKMASRPNGYTRDQLSETPQMRDAAKQLKEKASTLAKIRKEISDDKDRFYESNEREKYVDKAIDQYIRDNPDFDWTKDELKRAYMHDDFDQGDYSSYRYYVKDHPEKYNKIRDEMQKQVHELAVASADYAKKIVGEYGDIPVKYPRSQYSETVVSRVARIIADDAVNETLYEDIRL